MTHDRLVHHFGDLPATLIELSASLGDDMPSGMVLEDALAVIDERLVLLENPWFRLQTMTADAFFVSDSDAITDDRTTANWVVAPSLGSPYTATGDASTFTDDQSDPEVMRNMAGGGQSGFMSNYSGWVVIVAPQEMRLRITTLDSGMYDTIMAIWGPSLTPPDATTDPWHLSDDGYLSGSPDYRRSALMDYGLLNYPPYDPMPYGTAYSEGYLAALETIPQGLTLQPGVYWVAIWPYDNDEWDTGEGSVVVTITRIIEQEASFTIDAVVS